MRTNPFLVIMVSTLCLLTACKKSSNSSPADNYFKFTMDGNNYKVRNTYAIITSPGSNFIQGSISGNDADPAAGSPSVALGVTWNNMDSISKNDAAALAGKTLYFDDVDKQPELAVNLAPGAGTWSSVDTPDHNFFIKITSVTTKEKDDATGQYFHEITGTAHVVLMKNGVYSELTDGEFKMLVGGGGD